MKLLTANACKPLGNGKTHMFQLDRFLGQRDPADLPLTHVDTYLPPNAVFLHMDAHALGLQVPPQKVFEPSKPTPNTFSEGTWSPRACVSHLDHGPRRDGSHTFLALVTGRANEPTAAGVRHPPRAGHQAAAAVDLRRRTAGRVSDGPSKRG